MAERLNQIFFVGCRVDVFSSIASLANPAIGDARRQLAFHRPLVARASSEHQSNCCPLLQEIPLTGRISAHTCLFVSKCGYLLLLPSGAFILITQHEARVFTNT